jgi:hypothetical protein
MLAGSRDEEEHDPYQSGDNAGRVVLALSRFAWY